MLCRVAGEATVFIWKLDVGKTVLEMTGYVLSGPDLFFRASYGGVRDMSAKTFWYETCLTSQRLPECGNADSDTLIGLRNGVEQLLLHPVEHPVPSSPKSGTCSYIISKAGRRGAHPANILSL